MKQLLDVNVGLAATAGSSSGHQAAIAFLDEDHEACSLLFCRETQCALLRLLTNASVMQRSVCTQQQAWQAYDRLTADPTVDFASEPERLSAIFWQVSSRDEVSPKRWADDYLVAFADAAELQLVTFDKALARRARSARLLRA